MYLFSAGFGTSTSTGGTSLFGQPAAQTGGGLFGQTKPFGTATTTQSAGFGFGGTSTGSVFGQPAQSTVSISHLSLSMLGNFHAFVVVCSLFSKFTFSKNSFRNTIDVSNCLDPDRMSVLIRVQTVCKGYQQTTKERWS